MNIINVGGWYVGNSAILDWLDGFDEIAFIKGDFNIARLENGIMDIIAAVDPIDKIEMVKVQKIACYKSIYTVSRRYVGRYTKHLFKEYKSPSYDAYFKFYITLFKYLYNYEKKILSKIDFDEIEFWSGWMNTLPQQESNYKSHKHAVYQNPFFYDELFGGHEDVWKKLFSPYKLMFVHRDPLDQFSDIVNDGAHLNTSWSRFHGGTEDMHPADRFLSISKKIYNARIRMASEYTKNELIIFSFEEFIECHGIITDRLKDFLGLKEDRDGHNKRFVLEESKKNIGKGSCNDDALRLLEGKEYVMDEINVLRNQLINMKQSIQVAG